MRQRAIQHVATALALIPKAGGDPVTPKDVYCRGFEVQIPKWQTWARKAKEQLDQMIEKDAA